MPATNYYTIDGQMIGYKDQNGRKDFLTDALGSVTAEVDQSCTKTFESRYKPFGGDLGATGVRGHYGWIGSWGYRETDLDKSSHYVRARHYSKTSGTWLGVDVLFPIERAFAYANDGPTHAIDPSGLQLFKMTANQGGPILQIIRKPGLNINHCSPSLEAGIRNMCLYLRRIGNNDKYKINNCIAAASSRIGIDCQGITDNRAKCLQTFCNNVGNVDCSETIGHNAGMCPAMLPWNMDRDFPIGDIWIDEDTPGTNYAYEWIKDATDQGVMTFIHELMHACGQEHNNSDVYRQCNDIQACCMFEVLINKNDGHRCVNRIKKENKILK